MEQEHLLSTCSAFWGIAHGDRDTTAVAAASIPHQCRVLVWVDVHRERWRSGATCTRGSGISERVSLEQASH